MTSSTQTIAVDITCRRCGYNLRGLDEGGRCPECGIAVGLSTQGDLLRYADPRWLAKLKLGLWLMFAGAMCLIVMRLQNFVLPLRLPWAVQPFVYFGFALISISGIWLVTAPDPAGLAEAQYVTARKVIRITIIIGLGYWILAVVVQTRTISPDMRIIMQILAFVFGVAGVIGEAAKFKYLAQLAARIPRDPLVRFARLLIWGAPSVNILNVALVTAFPFISRARLSIWSFGTMFTIQSLLYLAIQILSAILYVRLARVVLEQQQSSQKSWAAAEGAVVR